MSGNRKGNVIGRETLLLILPTEYKDQINSLYFVEGGSNKKVLSKLNIIEGLGLEGDLKKEVEDYGTESDFKKFSSMLADKLDEKEKLRISMKRVDIEIDELTVKVQNSIDGLAHKELPMEDKS